MAWRNVQPGHKSGPAPCDRPGPWRHRGRVPT
jgi:hypothetical protein